LACVYLEGEYRPIAVHTEEDAFLLLQVLAHVLAARQNGMQGFTGCEALVAPHRHEQRLVTVDSLVQPLRVFAPMTGAVDERPGEYVVTIHGIRPIECNASSPATYDAARQVNGNDEDIVCIIGRPAGARCQCYRIATTAGCHY